MLAHHRKDPLAVLVPGGHVRLDRLVGQLVVGLNRRPIDRVEDRPFPLLGSRTPHSEGGHRIGDERGPRYKRNFLPVNWCSLWSLQIPKCHKFVCFNFWDSRKLGGYLVKLVQTTTLAGGWWHEAGSSSIYTRSTLELKSLVVVVAFCTGVVLWWGIYIQLGGSSNNSNIRQTLRFDANSISTYVH